MNHQLLLLPFFLRNNQMDHLFSTFFFLPTLYNHTIPMSTYPFLPVLPSLLCLRWFNLRTDTAGTQNGTGLNWHWFMNGDFLCPKNGKQTSTEVHSWLFQVSKSVFHYSQHPQMLWLYRRPRVAQTKQELGISVPKDQLMMFPFPQIQYYYWPPGGKRTDFYLGQVEKLGKKFVARQELHFVDS